MSQVATWTRVALSHLVPFTPATLAADSGGSSNEACLMGPGIDAIQLAATSIAQFCGEVERTRIVSGAVVFARAGSLMMSSVAMLFCRYIEDERHAAQPRSVTVRSWMPVKFWSMCKYSRHGYPVSQTLLLKA